VNNTIRTIMVWLVIGVILTMVFMQVGSRQAGANVLDYSTFMQEAQSGHIAKVKIDSSRTLKATTRDGKTYTVYTPGIQDPWMVSDLLKNQVTIEAKPEEEPSLLMNIFVSWFPMLLLIGVWIFFMRQMQGGGRGGAFSFGKSRARMLDESTNTVTSLATSTSSAVAHAGSDSAWVSRPMNSGPVKP